MSPLTGIFLDTGDIDEIRRFGALGVIRGVTTNPTILVNNGFVYKDELLLDSCQQSLCSDGHMVTVIDEK